jgi:glycosyltransferase involved in cell wall biosynthesis
MNKKKIILIGYDFDLEKSTGDKSFWKENIKFLSNELKEILVLNIQSKKRSSSSFLLGNCHVKIFNVKPVIMDKFQSKHGVSTRFWQNSLIPTFARLIEKTVDGIKISQVLKKLGSSFQFNHIHLMDNFGPANRIIVNSLKTNFSVSAVTYKGLYELVYDNFLKLSYGMSKAKVICRSIDFANKLKIIGIPEYRILHIPWGIHVNEKDLPKNKAWMKKRLGLPSDIPLYLWSGYIQPLGQKDFLFAFEAAKIAVEKGLKAVFYFAFKPESMDYKITKMADRINNIYISATTNDEFRKILRAADAFYCPIKNQNAILAPPLTWIEALGLGVPILTSLSGGVEEVIQPGKTGFIAKNKEELIKFLFIMPNHFADMRESCLKKVKEKYNIEEIAKKYLFLFTQEYDL